MSDLDILTEQQSAEQRSPKIAMLPSWRAQHRTPIPMQIGHTGFYGLETISTSVMSPKGVHMAETVSAVVTVSQRDCQ